MFFSRQRSPRKKIKKKKKKGVAFKARNTVLQPDCFLLACIPEAAFCRGEVAAVFEVAVKTKTRGGRKMLPVIKT